MTGSHLKWQAHMRNDRLMLKWQARMRNDGLMLKQWTCMWDEGLMFKTTASCAKWRACIWNNGPMFEMTGSHSKRRGHIRRLVFEMTCIGQCGWGALALCGPNGCHQEVAMKGSEGIKRQAAYSLPLHAPGGSLTPCVSSCIFLHHPKPLFPTRTLQQCEKPAYIPCWRGEAMWWLLARNTSTWGPEMWELV